jgi:hypothetical protein
VAVGQGRWCVGERRRVELDDSRIERKKVSAGRTVVGMDYGCHTLCRYLWLWACRVLVLLVVLRRHCLLGPIFAGPIIIG